MMTGTSPWWYDTYWLQSYYQALSYLEGSPLQHTFKETLNVFRVPETFVEIDLPSLFSAAEIDAMKTLISSFNNEDLESHELLDFGRMVVHDHAYFTQLQLQITERISDAVGEELEPSYNFLSLYNNLGVCAPHMDAPVAKWTVDFCIEQSAPWPLYVSEVVPWPNADQLQDDSWQEQATDNLTFHEHTMQPGDTLVFGGSSQWHYRRRIPKPLGENFCNLIFFHFIPKGYATLVRTK